MAVFLNLDEDDCESHNRSAAPGIRDSAHQDRLKAAGQGGSATVEGMNTTKNVLAESRSTNKVAAILTCYPVALSISSKLDLNDLDALAATCRSVHTSLTQYARQLKAHSLRCTHDARPVLAEVLAAPTERSHREGSYNNTLFSGGPAALHLPVQVEAAVRPRPASQPEGLYSSAGVSSKISSCARDLVAPCRRCGTAVCRNCAAKSPSNASLKDRYRRLCKTCLDAPIGAHLQPLTPAHDTVDGPPTSSASSIRSERSCSGSSTSSSTCALEDHEPEIDYRRSFTWPALLRGPCTCASRGVFLCAPCGQNLGAADTTYKRVWTWRSRYSTHIGGGLGTGLGEGNQGQKCGRGEDCLETSGKAVCWVEIDCSEGKAHDSLRENEGGGPSGIGTPDYSNNKPGYLQQEIEGIGGVVKKKVKKRVKVGATVWEYEDERESGKYLEREAQGTVRSWCGWCGRVCPGERDKQVLGWTCAEK
ncbi:uncharacterized protein Z518_01822 [Rhinocladiella mackenziei CBS 650.93]|uniref:Uncharacterized protein n=1 Tax=Rhinocladiella mackenziei CBS 650.93 TaxID=1442369 RepID=A0A0D2IMZ1_9EURO|nr:uncharacterized protein Z518_01822 [Rhinocladiella mackenziei CBS 650.93]KIX07169.1 hypothetical protein Z518_01822 [Rhinocladiella mackenziei CBS 650.93]